MAAPAVEAIHRAHPGARITALARPALLPLAALVPGVAEAIPAGPDDGPGVLLDSRRALREAGPFDTALVLPRGLRPLLGPALARIPSRVGFGGRGRRLLLTHRVTGWRPWRRAHRREWFGLLALPFGASVGGPSALVPPPAALAEADRLLRALGRRRDRLLVAMEPGAAYGPAKCWPAERFGDLAALFLARGLDVVTVGTPATRPLEDLVARRAGEGLRRAAGRTPDLAVLAGLLARADLVVANDTGPMHVAAAVGTPVLALFGATDPAVSGPAGPGRVRVLHEPEPCSPCFRRRCPLPGHPCLERLGVERVLREALDLLRAGPRPKPRGPATGAGRET
jgi:heptosyltransferase-2